MRITCGHVYVGGMEGGSEALADIRVQCSHTHNVGHALLLALLCQKLMTKHDKDVSSTRHRTTWVVSHSSCRVKWWRVRGGERETGEVGERGGRLSQRKGNTG